ncbi:MAG: YhhA family cyclophane-containing RiPP [Parvularculaceae bacterium]
MSNSQQARADDPTALKAAIVSAKSTNPALQRLKARVLSTVEPSAVITSYDRMHHRHSRSPG